jgi:hypothetical protein
MSTKHKVLIGLLAATLVLVATAIPSIAAPEKQFSLKTAQGTNPLPTIQAGTSTSFDAVLKNETPNGNSNISSIKVGFSGTGLTLNSATLTPAIGIPTISNNTMSVAVGGSPIKPQSSVTIHFTVTAPATVCAATQVPWVVSAYTGTSFNGDNFRLLNDPIVTSVTSSCQLQFVSDRGPKDAVKDVPITNVALNNPAAGQTVQVELLVNGVRNTTLFSGKTVTLTNAGTGTGTLSGNVAALASGVADFKDGTGASTLKIDTAGSYSLTASMTDTTLGVTPSAPVALTIFDTGIGCGPSTGGDTTFDSTVLTGQGQLGLGELTSTVCTGVSVISSSAAGSQQWDINESKGSSVNNKLTGVATFKWEYPATSIGTVGWTQISWKRLVSGVLTSTSFIDIPLCVPSHVNPLPPKTDPIAWGALFPTVSVDGVSIPAGACLIDSTLSVPVTPGGKFFQIQHVAVNEDLAGRSRPA